jgi:hypothetical protein
MKPVIKILALAIVLSARFLTAGAAEAITREEAKAIALRDAGAAEANVDGYRVTSDWDDGVETYEIEFFHDGAEYDYEMRVSDGAILECDREGGVSGGAPRVPASASPAPAAPPLAHSAQMTLTGEEVEVIEYVVGHALSKDEQIYFESRKARLAEPDWLDDLKFLAEKREELGEPLRTNAMR